MFNLETAISTWKRSLELNRSFRKDDIEELERHIRDVVQFGISNGQTEEEAYRSALTQMGDLVGLETEYRKVYWEKVFLGKRFLQEITWELHMFSNYVRMAIRNLWRNKGYTAINLLGLAAGLACVIFIGMFVQDELQYDRHNEHADEIVRVLLGDRQTVTPIALGPSLGREIPEIVAWTRIYPLGMYTPVAVRRGATSFQESGFFYADSSVFNVFTFEPLLGEMKEALVRPGTIMLTESTAIKYFGNENPIGQVIVTGGGNEFEVTLVVKDLPSTSHIQFDMLASFVSTSWASREMWGSSNFYTYLRLNDANDLTRVQNKIDELVAQAKAAAGSTIPSTFQFNLQRLTDIRLIFEGRKIYVYMFSAIGLLILLVECANYTNLATARAMRRAREVGIRKISGAHRFQLARQFFGESLLLVVIAMIVALALVYALVPSFNSISGKEVTFSLFSDWSTVPALLGVCLLIGFVAGIYPVLVLSSFQPVKVLKGSSRTGSGSFGFRRVLVVFQFSVTVFLLVGMLTVQFQLDHIQKRSLGFEKDNVVVLSIADRELRSSYQTIKDAFRSLGSVQSVSAIHSIPGYQMSGYGMKTEETGLTVETADDAVSVSGIPTDQDVVETLGLQIIAGSDFPKMPEYVPENGTYLYLVNHQLVRDLSWEPENAVGRKINLMGNRIGEIVGVYEDYHYRSLHQEIGAQALFIEPSQFGFIMLKVSDEKSQAVLAEIKEVWSRVAPGRPFEYRFLDAEFDALYRSDKQIGSVVLTFSILAVLIACLGLLGLASYSAEQRTKEIGIRKALGASVREIFVLMISELTRLVLVAIVIAVPVSWFVMTGWLDNFAYRIEMQWWIFGVAGMLALILAIATVSYQSIKAATSDPMKSLRHE